MNIFLTHLVGCFTLKTTSKVESARFLLRCLLIRSSISQYALALLFGVLLTLCGSIASASGQWTASLQVSGGKWGPFVFPSKAAAVAAMQAFDPPYSAAATVESIVSITSSTVNYQYLPRTDPEMFTPFVYFYNACHSPANCNWPSESAAVNDYISNTLAAAISSGYWCSTPTVTLTPSQAWVDPYGQPAGNFDTNDSRQYSLSVSGPYKANGCASFTTTSGFPFLRQRTASFPPWDYCAPEGAGTPTCTNPNEVGLVTGPLNECPANGSPSTSVGDPCDVLTGDFSQTESDYSGAGLKFERHYHSAVLESFHALGVGWTHNYAATLVIQSGVPVGLLRPDGHQDALATSSVSGTYISLSGAGIHVQASGSNWKALMGDGSSEVYNSGGALINLVTATGLVTNLTYTNGLLSSVADPFGHSLQFSYDSNNRISIVVEPDGSQIIYGYDTHNNLTSVTYPGGSGARMYQYTNSTFPNNLTGIIDESNNQFLSVQYDPTTGAATSSQQAGGALAVSITYSANGAAANDALGATNTYTFTNDPGFSPRVTSLVRNSLSQTFTVPAGATDPQRRVTQSIDANSNITKYAYDANHMTSKTEVFGTAIARTTNYPQYQDALTSLPTLITEPLKQTSYVYYPGTYQLHTKTITDTTATPNVSRTWTYTYNSYGQVLTVDGPRTDVADVTTYTYYSCTTGTQCGEIQTIKDALGHTTTINTYNAHGLPLTATDPNGVVTTLAYDARQRVLSKQVGTETTHYAYYPTGLLHVATLPDSSTLTYVYDAAHRLTDITDTAGNHIHYTLDAMGNHTAENVYDPNNSLHRTHSWVFNALNEMYQDISAAGTAAVTTTFGYDNNINQTSADAPLTRNTITQYDGLNRVSQITDPASGITKLAYDANNSLASVTDPRLLQTSYTNNGFGELTQLLSPDTGTTNFTRDSAGNLAKATDARSAIATYSYDSLNRVTQIAYGDQTINYGYDSGTNGVGHLTSASDANHSMAWAHDSRGRVTGKSQIVSGTTQSVGYAYTNEDLVSLTTPSGQIITYGYTNHRITSIQINGAAFLSGVTYEPFGPANFWTWSDGITVARAYNTDGNISTINEGSTLSLHYDNALRISSDGDNYGAGYTWSLNHDSLDRVNAASETGTTLGWTYDASGNRLTQTGASASAFTPSSSSNRLANTTGSLVRTYQYDAAGNTLGYTGTTFYYNNRGRLSAATVGSVGATYLYNALGQLYKKTVAGVSTLLMYDELGHLIGEYTGTGALIQETVWMENTPVATIRPNGSAVSVFFVQTDHLDAPRSVSRSSDHKPMWRWDPDAFGTSPPNQNPYGLGTFVYNLRFPGQLYQAETGLHNNFYRDYDPKTGRYIESDPMGLWGGLNTYAYANGNPVSDTDTTGLASPSDEARAAGLMPYPAPLPSPGVSPKVRKYICQQINDCAGNMNCVFNRINAARTNVQNGQADPNTWNDPTLRNAENFAAAGADSIKHYGYAAHNSFGTAFYQYFLKEDIYPLLDKNTTPVSDDAYAAGLLGNEFYHQPADVVLQWCNQCNTP